MIVVVSHGLGDPGAALCVTELARGGVRQMICVGSTGGTQAHVIGGDPPPASSIEMAEDRPNREVVDRAADSTIDTALDAQVAP